MINSTKLSRGVRGLTRLETITQSCWGGKGETDRQRDWLTMHAAEEKGKGHGEESRLERHRPVRSISQTSLEILVKTAVDNECQKLKRWCETSTSGGGPSAAS